MARGHRFGYAVGLLFGGILRFTDGELSRRRRGSASLLHYVRELVREQTPTRA